MGKKEGGFVLRDRDGKGVKGEMREGKGERKGVGRRGDGGEEPAFQ